MASEWFTTSPRICLRGCKTLAALSCTPCGRRYDPESDGRLRECRHDSERWHVARHFCVRDPRGDVSVMAVNPTLTPLAVAVVSVHDLCFPRLRETDVGRKLSPAGIEGRIYTSVEETFSALAVVQAFGREDWNDRYFKRCTGEALAATLSLTNVQLRFKVLIGLSTALGTAGILWIGARQAMAGEITVGAILLFFRPWGALHTDRVGHTLHPRSRARREASSECGKLKTLNRMCVTSPAHPPSPARGVTSPLRTSRRLRVEPARHSRTVVGYRPR